MPTTVQFSEVSDPSTWEVVDGMSVIKVGEPFTQEWFDRVKKLSEDLDAARRSLSDVTSERDAALQRIEGLQHTVEVNLTQRETVEHDRDMLARRVEALSAENDALLRKVGRESTDYAEKTSAALVSVVRAYDHHQDNIAEGLGVVSGGKLRDAIDAARPLLLRAEYEIRNPQSSCREATEGEGRLTPNAVTAAPGLSPDRPTNPVHAVGNPQPTLDEFDKGPWTAGKVGAYVESADFAHDARLNISGDFENHDARYAYACALAATLNRRTSQGKRDD